MVIFSEKKRLISHIELEHQSSEYHVSENFNNINKIFLLEKRNTSNNPNVATHENHAFVVIGARNAGKNYYMLKMLEKLGNQRLIHIITRSPNQYPNHKTSKEMKPINKYKGSVVSFDDILGTRNSSQIDDF